MPDLTPRQYRLGLLVAIVLHLMIVSLYVFNMIPQQHHPADRLFWFHNGGDNVGYFNQARSLLNGDLQPNKYTLGFPILLIPFMVSLQPPFQEDLLEPVSAFWTLVMFPLGQITLGLVATRLTGRRRLGLASVFVWTLLPLVVYGTVYLLFNAAMAETTSVHLLWAQMLSDGPATLFTLLAFAVFFRTGPVTPRRALLLGVLCGYLMLIRMTGAVTGMLIGVILLAQRRWLAAAILAVVAGLVFSPQLLYNAQVFGGPFASGYTVLDELPEQGLFHPVYLWDAINIIWTRMGLLLPLGLALGGLTGTFGFYALWQRNRLGAVVIGVWIISYLAVYGIYYYSWIGGLVRFLIPALPALAVLLVGVMDGLLRLWRQADANIPLPPNSAGAG